MSLMQDQIEALRQAMSEKSGDHNMKPCAIAIRARGEQ